MILEVGARPVFVDIDPVTRNIDLNRVEAAIAVLEVARDRWRPAVAP